MRWPRRCTSRCCLLLAFLSLGSIAQAEERWRVVVAELVGVAVEGERNPLLEMLAALDQQLEGVTLEVRLQPFARTMLLVQQGRAELQFPYIELPQAPEGLRYGEESIGTVRFMLYSRRDQPLARRQVMSERWRLSEARLAQSGLGFDTQQLERLRPLFGQRWRREQLAVQLGDRPELSALAFPYRIETDRAHVDALGIPVLPSNSVASSLEKLVRRRIDGYVLAPLNVEPEIDRLRLRDELQGVGFADYRAGWLVADTPQGAAIATRVSAGLRALKASGEFERLMGPMLRQMQGRDWP
ncbi:hypothetical protein [Pseudomonas sp. Gutcm_11s]|uniref:hypothetical protein n=1 Tax=Pseudomonas sp. Gutcm_11s TaxID=3026088 RepID=UPI0023627E03|nr:hypothetical protein [Pseudomonas sp. Gutcm_11s]MDD0845220.1 hypothetical protein [Pseudomonas sp. Gutcm_11s]